MTLYSAILNPSGPNFKNWMEVLGSNKVPLESPQLHHAQLGKEKNVEVYKLNLQAMTLRQRANLLARIARNEGVTIEAVEAALQEDGMPIRAADVIVSMDVRAFV